mmetsp:Transcript_23752/g.36433  ORF Transcript_23752/g.36433 Transcript_23752/m.36433 type:complete len:100 (+) Transcript_23752:389-688(+)
MKQPQGELAELPALKNQAQRLAMKMDLSKERIELRLMELKNSAETRILTHRMKDLNRLEKLEQVRKVNLLAPVVYRSARIVRRVSHRRRTSTKKRKTMK